MANDNSEDLKNKRPAPSSNPDPMDIDELIQENGKRLKKQNCVSKKNFCANAERLDRDRIDERF